MDIDDIKYTPAQVREHQEAWIEALCSGRYQQTHRAIEMKKGNPADTFGIAFDVFGVACDISGLGVWEYTQCDGWVYVIGQKYRADWIYPIPVAKWLGAYGRPYWHQLQVQHKTYGSQTLSSLANNYSLNFEQLAEVIKENLFNG